MEKTYDYHDAFPRALRLTSKLDHPELCRALYATGAVKVRPLTDFYGAVYGYIYGFTRLNHVRRTQVFCDVFSVLGTSRSAIAGVLFRGAPPCV